MNLLGTMVLMIEIFIGLLYPTTAVGSFCFYALYFLPKSQYLQLAELPKAYMRCIVKSIMNVLLNDA